MAQSFNNYAFISTIRKYVNSSILLVASTLLALVVANMDATRELYKHLWTLPVQLSLGGFNIFTHAGHPMTLGAFINDFLMAIFFLSVGLEIKREVLCGELSSVKKALLPVIGACGGMIVPVIVFFFLCGLTLSDPIAERGMAIPMATDIAFSLGVLSMFSKRVPIGLKVFLAALAVADDLGGILVIAIKYTDHLNTTYLLYALLVLFFVVGVVKTCGSFADLKKPEHAVKLFVRFAIAKGLISYGMELMLAILEIIQGVVSTIMNSAGFGTPQATILPQEIVTAVEDCGFFESIPLWAVTLIGGLFVWVLSFVMILSVYGRFFKMYMYTAIAPVPLSTFAGEPTQNIGKSFLKSYASVCMEGAIIVLACIIFSVFASSPPVVDTSATAASMVWSYIGELIFNMLILVGAVKMADRLVKEMMGI